VPPAQPAWTVDGAVFELQPTRSGWNYSVLHTFYNAPPKCADGSFASNPPTVLLDSSGNLYGPAIAGGANHCDFGTIWELVQSQGKWTLSVLYAFQGGTDGSSPQGSLTFDHDGKLYGITSQGGANGVGTVFKLIRQPGGPWSKAVLHSFGGLRAKDGDTPVAAPIFDRAGYLYGTTIYGGYGKGICSAFKGCGVIYQIAP